MRWQEHVEREGMRFAPAPVYETLPARGGPLKPYAAAVRGAHDTRPLVAEFAPDVMVVDILTVAATLAAELEGRTWATLVPHVMPTADPGFPVYSVGARRPRSAPGAALWRAFDPVVRAGVDRGRRELNGARERVGLPPLDHLHGGISRSLALVATFPQLEYPRVRPEPWARVTGPLLWEQPFGEVELPPGEDPLVLVAPSTSQDPEGRLVRAALEGLADEPVRVLATTNQKPNADRLRVPRNARVVDWLSYARTMPQCAVVVCHAGHGTVARSLASGVPLVACPAAGDMAENAARVAWSGAGVSLPRRLTTAGGVRLAVRAVLSEPAYTGRARQLAAWAAEHEGGTAAALEVERLAEGLRPRGRRNRKLRGWDSNPQPLD